jgi:hypothetical protein
MSSGVYILKEAHMNWITRGALFAGLVISALVLATTSTFGHREVRGVGIALLGVAGVLLTRRALQAGGKEAYPSLAWALAMVAGIVALGWDIRVMILTAVLAVTGAVLGRKYHVAL